MPLINDLSRYFGYDIDELVDRYHFLRSDIYRAIKLGSCEPYRSLQAFINVKEGAGLLTVAPDLNLSSALDHCDLPADCSGHLFSTAVPGPSWSKNVVVTGYLICHAVVSVVGEVETLGE